MVRSDGTLSLEEFLALPPRDMVCELMEGRVVSKATPTPQQVALQRVLFARMSAWCAGMGRVLPNCAIALKRQNADWVPVPALTYLSYHRLPETQYEERVCPIAPEVVVEIRSPSQTIEALTAKAIDYVNGGVSRVWLVNPETQQIRVMRPNRSVLFYVGETILVDDLLPGLKLTAKEIFDAATLELGDR